MIHSKEKGREEKKICIVAYKMIVTIIFLLPIIIIILTYYLSWEEPEKHVPIIFIINSKVTCSKNKSFYRTKNNLMVN